MYKNIGHKWPFSPTGEADVELLIFHTLKEPFIVMTWVVFPYFQSTGRASF